MRTKQLTKRSRQAFFLIIVLISSVVPVINSHAEQTTPYYQESLAELDNPERGFYEPIYLTMQVSGNEIKDWDYNLVHLRVGVSAFSKAGNEKADLPFSQDMLDALDGTLKNIKKNGGSVILRFAYDDFDGTKDMEPSMDMMLQHIKQLKPLFEENADVISYVELGFFGPWGEMHSSSMCTTENVSMAIDAMLKAVPEPITIGVRTPRYYAAWANVERENLNLDITKQGSDAYRVGLYNDGYLGSESDLGTFANREIEVAWLNNQARHTFYGGEVVANYAEKTPLNTVAYLSVEGFQTHTTYLNRYWNNTVIDSWMEEIYQGEDERYQGQTGYTYAVNHLGYRFVLRQCQLSKQLCKSQNLSLNMSIENVGFANLINEKVVSILLQGQNDTYEIVTDISATQWDSKEITNLQKEIVLPKDIKAGEYEVFLRISKYGNSVSDNNYQCIQLANDNIWNEQIGANKLGTIDIVEEIEPAKKDDTESSDEVEDKASTNEEVTQTENNKLTPGEQVTETSPEEFAQDSKKETQIFIEKIELSGISKKIAAGKKIQLEAEITPQNASDKKLKWTSSNKKYATVDKNGLVKVKKAGAGCSVTIKAVSTDGSKVTATYKIKIMKKAVQKLTIKASKKEVKAGKKIKIKATISPVKKVNSKLKYTSSNTKYAKVDAKGVVKTKKKGKGKTVKITVRTTDGSNLKKTVKIKIK